MSCVIRTSTLAFYLLLLLAVMNVYMHETPPRLHWYDSGEGVCILARQRLIWGSNGGHVFEHCTAHRWWHLYHYENGDFVFEKIPSETDVLVSSASGYGTF